MKYLFLLFFVVLFLILGFRYIERGFIYSPLPKGITDSFALFGYFLCYVFFAPLVEEVLYKKVFYKRLMIYKHCKVILLSLLFTLQHLSLSFVMLGMFVYQFFSLYFYSYHQSIFPYILLHSSVNLVLFICYYNEQISALIL